MSIPAQKDAAAIGEPILLLAADDLLFTSRIESAVRPLRYTLRVAASPDKIREIAAADPPPAAILISLSARRFDPNALIRALKTDAATRAVPLLAFAGHVEKDKHDAARAAGADLTAANSSVAQHLPRLLARLLARERPHDEEDGEDGPSAAG